MLKFYGIRFNQNGSPERFSLSFALGESLHTGLHICEQKNGDIKETATPDSPAEPHHPAPKRKD